MSDDLPCADESQFLDRLKRGDASIAEDVLAHFDEAVKKVILRCPPQDRDDVRQEMVVMILEQREWNIPDPGKLQSWIVSIARKSLRSMCARKGFELRDDDALEFPESPEEPQLSERNLILCDLIAKLPEKKRDLYAAMTSNSNKKYEEFAHQYECTVGAARIAAYRLKVELQELLEKKGHAVAADDSGPGSIDQILMKLVPVLTGRRIISSAEQLPRNALTIKEVRRIAETGIANTKTTNDNSQRVSDSKPVECLNTGFSALDTLLGGQGFIRGSTIVIQGQSGTGKTTLALQIAKHATLEEGHYFVFASVEDQPEALLNYITRPFWEKNFEDYLGDRKRWHTTDLTKYFDDDVARQGFARLVEDLGFEAGLQPAERDALRGDPDKARGFVEEMLTQERAKREVGEKVREMEFDRLLGQIWDDLPVEDTTPVILVVDSLNALIHGASVRFQKMPDRQVMLAVLHSFRNWRRKRIGLVTVIFLVEDDAQVFAAMSYMADAVIHLRTESTEQTVYEMPRHRKSWIQERRFCKVRKGRGLPIQSRSCCYEFIKWEGIKFLPTYAAPGIVSLFEENAPMKEVIRALRTNDVPSLYPQIVVQEFSRPTLQRVFSVRRRSDRISLRHPMMLSNVDEHWLMVLREANLLQPIPPDKLNIFSLPLGNSPGSTRFIEQLDKKRGMFEGQDEDGNDCLFGVPQIANVGMFVYRKDVLRTIGAAPPETYEEMESICLRLRTEKPNEPNKLFLELESYDTFLATALEIGWGHGAFWHTEETDGLRIRFEDGCTVWNLVAALERIKHWIHGISIVPKGCTLDPDDNPKDDWVFARHWYSTWIHLRTHRRSIAFVDDDKYGILPIPFATSHQREKGNEARHISAWGEWYLAIQRGSENVELGIDLINNLMTARKITERALSGAALPTVQKFYEITDETCPHTDRTFHEIRDDFLHNAKSRSDFANYPVVARIFSGVLRTIATNPKADVAEAVQRAFHNIDPKFEWPKKHPSSSF